MACSGSPTIDSACICVRAHVGFAWSLPSRADRRPRSGVFVRVDASALDEQARPFASGSSRIVADSQGDPIWHETLSLQSSGNMARFVPFEAVLLRLVRLRVEVWDVGGQSSRAGGCADGANLLPERLGVWQGLLEDMAGVGLASVKACQLAHPSDPTKLVGGHLFWCCSCSISRAPATPRGAAAVEAEADSDPEVQLSRPCLSSPATIPSQQQAVSAYEADVEARAPAPPEDQARQHCEQLREALRRAAYEVQRYSAATTIQAVQRGNMVRARLRAERLAAKILWQEALAEEMDRLEGERRRRHDEEARRLQEIEQQQQVEDSRRQDEERRMEHLMRHDVPQLWLEEKAGDYVPGQRRCDFVQKDTRESCLQKRVQEEVDMEMNMWRHKQFQTLLNWEDESAHPPYHTPDDEDTFFRMCLTADEELKALVPQAGVTSAGDSESSESRENEVGEGNLDIVSPASAEQARVQGAHDAGVLLRVRDCELLDHAFLAEESAGSFISSCTNAENCNSNGGRPIDRNGLADLFQEEERQAVVKMQAQSAVETHGQPSAHRESGTSAGREFGARKSGSPEADDVVVALCDSSDAQKATQRTGGRPKGADMLALALKTERMVGFGNPAAEGAPGFMADLVRQKLVSTQLRVSFYTLLLHLFFKAWREAPRCMILRDAGFELASQAAESPAQSTVMPFIEADQDLTPNIHGPGCVDQTSTADGGDKLGPAVTPPLHATVLSDSEGRPGVCNEFAPAFAIVDVAGIETPSSSSQGCVSQAPTVVVASEPCKQAAQASADDAFQGRACSPAASIREAAKSAESKGGESDVELPAHSYTLANAALVCTTLAVDESLVGLSPETGGEKTDGGDDAALPDSCVPGVPLSRDVAGGASEIVEADLEMTPQPHTQAHATPALLPSGVADDSHYMAILASHNEGLDNGAWSLVCTGVDGSNGDAGNPSSANEEANAPDVCAEDVPASKNDAVVVSSDYVEGNVGVTPQSDRQAYAAHSTDASGICVEDDLSDSFPNPDKSLRPECHLEMAPLSGMQEYTEGASSDNCAVEPCDSTTGVKDGDPPESAEVSPGAGVQGGVPLDGAAGGAVSESAREDVEQAPQSDRTGFATQVVSDAGGDETQNEVTSVCSIGLSRQVPASSEECVGGGAASDDATRDATCDQSMPCMVAPPQYHGPVCDAETVAATRASEAFEGVTVAMHDDRSQACALAQHPCVEGVAASGGGVVFQPEQQSAKMKKKAFVLPKVRRRRDADAHFQAPTPSPTPSPQRQFPCTNVEVEAQPDFQTGLHSAAEDTPLGLAADVGNQPWPRVATPETDLFSAASLAPKAESESTVQRVEVHEEFSSIADEQNMKSQPVRLARVVPLDGDHVSAPALASTAKEEAAAHPIDKDDAISGFSDELSMRTEPMSLDTVMDRLGITRVATLRSGRQASTADRMCVRGTRPRLIAERMASIEAVAMRATSIAGRQREESLASRGLCTSRPS